MTIYEGSEKLLIQCIENSGKAFDYTEEYAWYEHYVGVQKLFGGKWELSRSDIPDDIRKLFSQAELYPEGIQIRDNTRTTRDDIARKPIFARNPPIACNGYYTELAIHVSAQTSEDILKSVDGSRIVVVNSWKSDCLNEAIDFKDKVLNLHGEVLEQLFNNVIRMNKYCMLNGSKFEFQDFHSYELSRVGMESLNVYSQFFGLMMAVCEHSREKIPLDEYWLITRCDDIVDHIDDRIKLTKYSMGFANTGRLKSW